MQLARAGRRRRLMLLAVVAAVAAIAAACLPPPPPPPPPTTTTTRPQPPQCPSGMSTLESDASPTPADQYTAVVKHAGRTKVLVRAAKTQADIDRFRADAAAQGEVLAFAEDNEVHALDQSETWGFTDSAFRASWAEATPTATAGTGVRVAVLDTGVETTHPDFVDTDFDAGIDFVNLCQNSASQMVPTPGVTTDPNGHGTHVAGILAASDNGIGVVGGAPDVTLIPVRVLDAAGDGSYGDVAAAILWAADTTKGNASVISMSLGGPNDGNVVGAAINTVETDPGYTHPVILVAAGNSSGSAPEYPAVYGGTYPELLPVAALCKPGFPTSSNDHCSSPTETIADFSSHPWTGTGLQTGVSAPGVAIISTSRGGGYRVLSGTSMATPFVAAVAALVVAHCPGDTAGQVVGRIEQVAATHDLGAPGVDTTYGFGRIDADASVQAC